MILFKKKKKSTQTKPGYNLFLYLKHFIMGNYCFFLSKLNETTLLTRVVNSNQIIVTSWTIKTKLCHTFYDLLTSLVNLTFQYVSNGECYHSSHNFHLWEIKWGSSRRRKCCAFSISIFVRSLLSIYKSSKNK